jgi:hypothetical protein
MLCSCICTIATSGGVILVVVSSSDPDLYSPRCNASSEERVDLMCPTKLYNQPHHQDEVVSPRTVPNSNCLSRSRAIVWRDVPSSGGSCMELEPTATSKPFAHQAEGRDSAAKRACIHVVILRAWERSRVGCSSPMVPQLREAKEAYQQQDLPCLKREETVF